MTSPTVDRRFGLVGNAALKAPVAAIATTNITLSGQQTIDGVAVLATNAAGVPDRVLVTGKSDPAQNGIYDVSLNAWTRSADADGPYDFARGSMVLVNGGTTNATTVWMLTTAGAITIGTTALTWQLSIGASMLSAVLAAQASAAAAELSAAQAAAIVLGNFLQTGTGAESRTFPAKMRDFVSVLDFIPVAEHAAIKAGTSVFDCYSSIMEAINSQTFFSGAFISGPAIYFPPGQYKCNSTIQLKRMVRLWGDGSGMPGAPSVNIIFPAGVSGIIVHRDNTIDATTAASTTDGDGSIIEGLQLVGAYSAAPDTMGGHGVWFRARGVLRNCLVANFSGDGIRVIATAGGGGAVEGNANGTVIDTVRSQGNGEWGLQVAGADANAGLFRSVDTSHNGTGGIFDNSFLGNQYDQPQAAGNGSAAAGYNSTRVRTGTVYNAGSWYIGLYPATNAQLVATVPGTDSTIWLRGGAQGAADAFSPQWLAAQPLGTYFSSNQYRFTNLNSSGLVNNPYQEGGYSLSYVTGPTLIVNGAISGLTSNWLSAGSNTLSYTGQMRPDTIRPATGIEKLDTTGLATWQWKSPATGRLAWHVSNIERDYLTFYDYNATVANGYARTIGDATAAGGGIGQLGLGATYFRGGIAAMKWRGLQAAAPTTTVQLVGDSFEFLTPAAGGFMGQVCTVAGTPGTWRNYGEVGGGGNTVVQGAGPDKTGGVNANGRHMQITTNNSNLAAGAVVLFTWTNVSILANDIVAVNRKSGGTAGAYQVWCDSVAAGSCVIAVQNVTGGALAEAIVLQLKVVPSFIAA